MKWVETIVLRSVNRDRSAMETDLRDLVDAVGKDRRNPGIRIYRRPLLDNDFCIQLLHESDRVAHGGSRLGLRLVSALKEFGLVNHTLWIEL